MIIQFIIRVNNNNFVRKRYNSNFTNINNHASFKAPILSEPVSDSSYYVWCPLQPILLRTANETSSPLAERDGDSEAIHIPASILLQGHHPD
jgi:hypothetical protein